MEELVIKVEQVGKLYRLGEVGTGTISHDLNRWWARVRHKEDPTSKVAEVNDRTLSGTSDFVWALQEVNFEVKKGEVLGIVGRNGAGKSTLLKILSKVTRPSTGVVRLKGRVASLLEVGTGFHPELTGRENVFLNGAILGMTRREIKSKFDEIVDFAGVQRYIDTPVKRYSSGMYVRLAFAVAAHLEPEILIVDEVLAVGDAEFQKRCLGKMNQVSHEQGRTILFVSHNIAAVKSLCTSGILLENGRVAMSGTANEVASKYLTGGVENEISGRFIREYNHERFALHAISICEKGEDPRHPNKPLDEFSEIQVAVEISFFNEPHDLHVTLVLHADNGEPLFSFSHKSQGIKLRQGLNYLICSFPKGFLNIGNYFLSLYVIQNSRSSIFSESNIASFHVQEGQREIGRWMGKEPGFIKPAFSWSNN